MVQSSEIPQKPYILQCSEWYWKGEPVDFSGPSSSLHSPPENATCCRTAGFFVVTCRKSSINCPDGLQSSPFSLDDAVPRLSWSGQCDWVRPDPIVVQEFFR
ncbi:MAG TPA: hypothetical protein DC058_19580 [Planctomycetaceae bacterium]|nr:hypothetical protein [Planctomycetaceae bacterium]